MYHSMFCIFTVDDMIIKYTINDNNYDNVSGRELQRAIQYLNDEHDKVF